MLIDKQETELFMLRSTHIAFSSWIKCGKLVQISLRVCVLHACGTVGLSLQIAGILVVRTNQTRNSSHTRRGRILFIIGNLLEYV